MLNDYLEWLFPYDGWRYAAVLFYLVAGWQRLCVLTLTDPGLAQSMAYGLRANPVGTRVLNLLFILFWLPLTLGGLVVGWRAKSAKENVP